MAGSYRETSSPEVPFHTLSPAQIISPQQLSNSPATKMQKQRVQNGNFCSAFPISAGLKPPNAQQQGLQLSRTKNKQTHQKKPNTPFLSLPIKDPVLYSTKEIFTHASLYSLHCFKVIPSIPSQTKKTTNKPTKKTTPTLHSEEIDGLTPELQQGGYIWRCSC